MGTTSSSTMFRVKLYMCANAQNDGCANMRASRVVAFFFLIFPPSVAVQNEVFGSRLGRITTRFARGFNSVHDFIIIY